MKRVVLTGATGAVGTALIKELIKNNIEVLVFCRKDSLRNHNIPESSLVTKKYCDLTQLKEVQNDTGEAYDVFYHFAWAGTTGVARNDMYLQNKNVEYSLDAVVEAAKRFGCHTFIGAGSQAEYGRSAGVLKADTPAFPENGYGMAKLCAGQMSRNLCEQYGMRHIWTRILSIYGPNDGENSMIMSTIKKLMSGEKASLTKGEQQWDYLYSGDAGTALALLGKYGKHGKIYCLGSGKTRTLAEYAKIVRDRVNPQGELGIGEIPYAKNQVMYLCADISDLKKDTGFEPKYTFEEGIQETIEWYKGKQK